MQLEYYSLPLKPEAIMCRKEHPKCSLRQSVAQQLHLILTTAFGEVPTEENFGCNIWDHDFDKLTSGTKIMELIRQSLLLSIRQYEKRLGNVRVDVNVQQEEFAEGASARRIKKRLNVTVSGLLQTTNETFTYNDRFFVGPLSY